MNEAIKLEYAKVVTKRDEIKAFLQELEEDDPKDHYNIRITRDRLAYWEGKAEGLRFALDHLDAKD